MCGRTGLKYRPKPFINFLKYYVFDFPLIETDMYDQIKYYNNEP